MNDLEKAMYNWSKLEVLIVTRQQELASIAQQSQLIAASTGKETSAGGILGAISFVRQWVAGPRRLLPRPRNAALGR